MKKKIILLSLTAMLATGVSAYAETTEEIQYDGNGWPMVRYITTPMPEIKSPTEIQMPEEEKEWERIPPLTEAPEVGTILANILKEGDNLDLRNASSYTKPYATHSIGQCAWYADGRFMEVYGIRMPFGMGAAKKWLYNAYKSNEIKIITDLNEIPEQSIAVFEPSKQFEDWPGHVVFIEYVERDVDGNPQNVFYTEANGANDLNKGQYDPGYDGTVQKKNFDDFKNQYGLKLLGYIVPNE